MGSRIHLPDIRKVVGIVSGKGGVGKSFFTANLALALVKLGARVGIMDADICCPSQFRLFGITEKITPQSDTSIIPIEKWGIRVVSMAGLCATPDEAVLWRGPILSKIIRKLLKESRWGALDFILIDFPPGTSDSTLTILQEFSVDGVILVTSPQELVTLDVRRAGHMAQMLEVPMLGVVENMRSEIFGEGGGRAIAERFHIPLLGSIPLRKQIVDKSDEGEPALFHLQELELIFGKIARALVEQVFGTLEQESKDVLGNPTP